MKLNWLDETRPFAADFDDIYYAAEDGLGETRYLFIKQNDLEHRFGETSDYFTIGELGFGTGLNFLGTWQAWLQSRPHRNAMLHYISCEKFPLSHDQISRALSRWPELNSLTQKFLKSYVESPRGFYRFNFDDDGVILTLLIGDAAESLGQLEANVDAWYLDGFAPRKNPEIWSEQVFSQLTRLSRSDATFATYTVTGFVRRNLMAAGFSVEKFEGFGKKRQMLRGRFNHTHLKSASTVLGTNRMESNRRRVAIVGAGLAGCALANSLAKRGYPVTIIDRANSIASEGSGNPAGIAMPTLTAEPTVLSSLGFSGLTYLRSSASVATDLSHPGLLQFVENLEKLDRFRRGLQAANIPESFARILDPEEAGDVAGMPLKNQFLYFAHANWHSPADLARAWINRYQNNIRCILNSTVVDIRREGDLFLIEGRSSIIAEAEIVILASAHESRAWPISKQLPLRKVRGQVARVEWPDLKSLKIPICFENYITPMLADGSHLIGASYDRENLDTEVRAEENQKMIEAISGALDLDVRNARIRDSRVNFRTSCPGQEPIAGQLIDGDGTPIQNLYALTALASKGLIYSPLLADLMASKINGEPLSLPLSIIKQIEPSRFQKS